VPRLRARSRFARLAPRLFFASIGAAAIASGIAAGCGIDYEGMLVRDVGLDASENVGANLPEASADGSADALPTDAGQDGDGATASSCKDSRCVDAGGQCDLASNACTFQCDGGPGCAAGLTCPPGVPCRVTCAADNGCAGLIDCTQASACDISCLGAHTCQGVACSGSSCHVACIGFDSCGMGSVTCDASRCDIACVAEGGVNNCKDLVSCHSAVACSIDCNAGGCVGGALAVAPDAAIRCGDNACKAGATCRAELCDLDCKGGACATKLCCEAGTCLVEGGVNICP
jgi:hypothetical protein